MSDTNRLPGANLDLWSWQLGAACRGMDSSVFFHPTDERDDARRQRIADAKAICATCPAIDACRSHALEVREPYGIWGGLSESDRAKLLNRRILR